MGADAVWVDGVATEKVVSAWLALEKKPGHTTAALTIGRCRSDGAGDNPMRTASPTRRRPTAPRRLLPLTPPGGSRNTPRTVGNYSEFGCLKFGLVISASDTRQRKNSHHKHHCHLDGHPYHSRGVGVMHHKLTTLAGKLEALSPAVENHR